MQSLTEALLEIVGDTVGRIDPDQIEMVAGGSINRSYRVTTLRGAVYLLKTNEKSAFGMFEAEREALQALRYTDAIRVPEPIQVSIAGDSAFLLLEYIEFGRKTALAARACGSAMAVLHRQIKPQYGWHRDNTIGRTPQVNDWTDDWIEFLRVSRLGYQLKLAAANGIDAKIQADGQKLLEELPKFFSGYEPAASLSHGDLWGGNWGATYGEEPVIFDPATYYGDREADIAMTKLFGGFGIEFYAAYNEAWPLDAGFAQRCDLYNLYHVLNHYNLFGGGYQQQAGELLNNLLA